jgi:hypothetical protein
VFTLPLVAISERFIVLKVLYEAQPKNSRKCGAYCARMILKSKGITSFRQ